MSNTNRTREQIISAAMKQIDQYVASIGTVGDRTTLADIENMAPQELTTEWIRGQFSAIDRKQLQESDILAIRGRLIVARDEAREILTSDSIFQRIERSASQKMTGIGDSFRTIGTGLVRLDSDSDLPSLPFTSPSRSPRVR